MPSMIKRSDMTRISRALESQRRTGRPSLTLSNRPTASQTPTTACSMNRNLRLVPKPMRQEDIEAVRKLTGFGPLTETKWVRP
jgi:tRNA A37 N6-isopentenylltransferase MiaA